MPPARDGRMLIANLKAVGELWNMQLNPAKGTTSGEPQLITGDETAKQYPSISRDGSRLAYEAGNTRPPVRIEIRLRDMADGRESALMVRGPALGLQPKPSVDGSVLAYREFLEGKWRSFLVAGKAASGKPICEDCIIRSLFSNPEEAIVQYQNELVRQNLSTGSRLSILKAADGHVLDADLSPDDRWVVFVLGKPSGANALYVVPVGQSPVSHKEWIQVADEDFLLDSPRWSADGNLLYFVSERDGRPCIWAQPMHPQTRKPTGSALEIYHEKRARYAAAGPKRWQAISVARDKLIALRCNATGNIWLANLETK